MAVGCSAEGQWSMRATLLGLVVSALLSGTSTTCSLILKKASANFSLTELQGQSSKKVRTELEGNLEF